MTKEWQEATNEYLKVGSILPGIVIMLILDRKKESILSTVFRVMDIQARALYRASLRRHRVSAWSPKTICRPLYQIWWNEPRPKSSLLGRLLGACVERLWQHTLYSTCTELDFTLYQAIEGSMINSKEHSMTRTILGRDTGTW